jgi:hypothetical protein
MLHDYVKVAKGSLLDIIMDGADPVGTDKLLFRPPTMPYPTLYRFALQFAEIQNRTVAAEGFVGIGARTHKSQWKFGKWVDSTSTYTDQTTAAQEIATSNDVTLETLTNNDGFVIASQHLFNLIDIYASTASVGAGVRVLEYTKADGTWGSITNAYVMPPSAAEWLITGSHENLIAFEPPMDWAKAVAAHGTNVPLDHFCIRVRATTAPSTAGLARSITIAMGIMGVASLGTTVMYTSGSGSSEHAFNNLSDGLVAVSTTPGAQNVFRVNVRVMG